MLEGKLCGQDAGERGVMGAGLTWYQKYRRGVQGGAIMVEDKNKIKQLPYCYEA